ncbi:hypothetical protein BSLG_005844 [Batrachochytrium salamandrivorans]|nr:hypothetical protein BSLG_005844 [Batrachochytrium salamandrivorans]
MAQRTIAQAVVYGAHETANAAAPTVFSKSLPASALAGIQSQLAASNFLGKAQEVRLLFGVPGIDAPIVGVVGLGKPCTDVQASAETARLAALEGAHLSTYAYDELKGADNKASPVTVSAMEGIRKGRMARWQCSGSIPKLCSPFHGNTCQLHDSHHFLQQCCRDLQGIPNVTVTVRNSDFMEEKKMGSFLSVSRGSEQPPKLLEVHYNGGVAGTKPLAFVGKGVTFDSGGISLKPPTDMALMKGDMGGAACVLGATGRATKPGDVVIAMNGKTIEVDNTDAEGRLILADAIYYASTTFKPHSLVELSTLTGAMKLEAAGEKSGDPFWRMPLSEKYKKQISSHVADLKNVGGRTGGSCTAAIFLKEFVPTIPTAEGSDEPAKLALDYAHVDIAGVMEQSGASGYLAKGMTGRPTRSLIAYAQSL